MIAITITLIALLASPSFCSQSPTRYRSMEQQQKDVAIVEKFPWEAIFEHTGINPSDYLPIPVEGSTETLACTTKPGPDRIGCPRSIDVWNAFTHDGYIVIEAGQCFSVTAECCQTIACAPSSGLAVPLDDITGRMWNPLSIRCVMGGTGGVWQNGGGTTYIQVHRPDDSQCSA